MGALTGTGVRILLIGTGQHTAGSELPDLPTVSTTVTDLAGAFVERCGAQLEQVKVLLDKGKEWNKKELRLIDKKKEKNSQY